MNSLIWRLLRRNISPGQIAGYAVASLVGLCIVMVALQLYGDIEAARTGDDAFLSRDYLILSRKVSSAATITGQTESLSARDIRGLERQPWVKGVAPFTAADFRIYASVSMQQRGEMQSFLFFEAIPDDYLDISPQAWHFTPGDTELPIIMSRDYLQLYNFGFAATRGLPQISENMVSRVPVGITIVGRGGKMLQMQARIVGFSSRLNTIAVPQSFIDWANAEYGQTPGGLPTSRVIVEVTDPGNPAIKRYIDSHGLETAGDKADASRATFFLRLVTGIVVAVGAVISLLALFILMLSVHLLLQKNRLSLHLLMQLGYTPSQVTRYYYTLVGAVSIVVYGLAVAVTAASQWLWTSSLSVLSVRPSSLWLTLVIGAGIIVAVTFINYLSIRRHIRRTFRL